MEGCFSFIPALSDPLSRFDDLRDHRERVTERGVEMTPNARCVSEAGEVTHGPHETYHGDKRCRLVTTSITAILGC